MNLPPQVFLDEHVRVAEGEVRGVDESPEEVVSHEAEGGSGETLEAEDLSHREVREQMQTELLPRQKQRQRRPVAVHRVCLAGCRRLQSTVQPI